MRPVDPVTLFEAASILGCSVPTVHAYIDEARLPARAHYQHLGLERSDVEALAAHVYSWMGHRNDPDPYWVAGARAAETLGLSRDALEELANKHRVPSITHRDGTRLYRSAQLAAILATRDARTWI